MKKTKVLLTLACAVLLIAASFMGTLAYLTDTEEVKNTFTVGKVDITLDEAKVNGNGKPINREGSEVTDLASAERVKENNYKLMPGHSYTKDPTVTVLANSEKSYVRLLVTVSFDKTLTDTQLATELDTIFNGYDSKWIRNAKEVKNNVTVGTGTDAKTYTICTSTLNESKREFLTVSSSDYPDANGNYGEDSHTTGSAIPSPKYAKTAENTENLVNQFISIAEDVGGADIELDENAVLLDAISQYFTLPEELLETIGDDGKPDANTLKKYIKVYTAEYDGTSFGKEVDFDDANVEISKGEDGRYSMIRVTNFDYSDNFVSTHGRGKNDFHGKKLIVKIAINSNSKFLGGNNVVTNGTASGIYDGGNKISGFPVPEANVQIKQNDADMESNVYLGGYYSRTITSDQIKENTKITIGGVTLDLSKGDYGLEAWQTEYVTVEITIKGEDGKTFTPQELTEDMKYTVTVTIKPKEAAKETSAGAANDMKGNNSNLTNTIHVFKPELTFKDSEVWYGGDEPTVYTSNLTQTRWLNDKGTASTDENVTMLGEAPNLALSFAPDEAKIKDNKINSKQDIPVDVTVKINDWDVTQYVKFIHTKCADDSTCTDPTDGKFWIHVNTCSLTITKAAGANTTIGNDEYFVFTVKKDGEDYTQVTIKGIGSVTISELPVGSYTVEEDTSTAWRYTSAMSQNPVTLSKDNTSGSVTCTNTIQNEKWLNHFNRVTNILGQANPTPDYQN